MESTIVYKTLRIIAYLDMLVVLFVWGASTQIHEYHCGE